MTNETGPTRAPTPPVRSIPPKVAEGTTLPARAGGEAAAWPSLVPQRHGGALLSGGKPGNPGHNQHTSRHHAQEVRGQLVAELEGAAKDLSELLETARECDGDRLRCKGCGAFIPGMSKLNLRDILAVIRELRSLLPTTIEHEGAFEIGVTVVGGVQIVPNRPAQE